VLAVEEVRMSRGVLYLVWDGPPGLTGCGQVNYQGLLDRSIASVQKHLPGMPVEVVRCDPNHGLRNKTRMGRLTPFDSTLFLDADTVLLGDLSHAWWQAERFGLACCVGQCPWLRRYGNQWGDAVEYNTGVLFFTGKASPVMDLWERFGNDPWSSRFLQGNTPCGLDYDDQGAFGRAVQEAGYNPYVLPPNYNFMPGWQTRFFTPMKVWHSTYEVPDGLEEKSLQAASGSPIRFCEMAVPRGGAR
jgi:hypothetical protein